MDETWNLFPKLVKVKTTDLTEHNILETLQDFINAGHVNFKTGRKELYRLSVLIENYAVKHNSPLLATFETEERYKYVEEHYTNILSKIPKAWIIGNFNNPLLAPQPPASTEVVSCDGTNVSDMWIVVTRGSDGPFGLVAENIGYGQYRGFFSYSPMIISKVVQNVSTKLKVGIDI